MGSCSLEIQSPELFMIDHSTLSQWLEIAILAAYQGGDVLKKFWGRVKNINEKSGAGDLVTEADQQSEAAIIAFLLSYFPEHQVMAEESGQSENKSDWKWIIDPLDGTTNYTHQYPMVAVSIGLVYHQEPILGVIYNPFTQELFHAAKGLGAYLNHQPIAVSQTKQLKDSLLATGFAYDRRETSDTNYAEFCHLTHLTQGVRRAGAAALDLAYVACGRLDGYWERGIKPWDIAAGIILVQEAGGEISDYQADSFQLESGRILATNHHLHTELDQVLKSVKNKSLSLFS